MSHKAQIRFCQSVQRKFPLRFFKKRVVDVGSLDINGNNKRFFWFCDYTGIDLYPGKNVDIVGFAHNVLRTSRIIDTIISTEALEHDEHWYDTLLSMYMSLKPGGLLVLTCAGEGREEHGTSENHSWCSPGTNHYYKNISMRMFSRILPPSQFSEYMLRQKGTDLQFYGIKR